jgi:hypothetical protein
MNVEIIYESPFASLWFHPDYKIIHHSTHKDYGKWEATEFREMMMLGTRIMAERGATKWLSDDTYTLALSKEEYQWGVEYWFPETIKAGWKHWAIVQPNKIIAQLNMEKVVKEYKEQGINAKFFTEVDVAFNWLTNV